MKLYQVTLDFSYHRILKEYAENSPLKIQIFTLFIHKATILFSIIYEMSPEL